MVLNMVAAAVVPRIMPIQEITLLVPVSKVLFGLPIMLWILVLLCMAQAMLTKERVGQQLLVVRQTPHMKVVVACDINGIAMAQH